MPSSSRRRDEPPLSHEQSRLAGNLLKKNFDPARGVEQLTHAAKENLVSTINKDFAKHGHAPTYSLTKLDCWTGNALYRWRCVQTQRRPLSWQPKCAIAAAKFAAQKAQREGTTAKSATRDNLAPVGLALLVPRTGEADVYDTGTPPSMSGAPALGEAPSYTRSLAPSQRSPSRGAVRPHCLRHRGNLNLSHFTL